MKVPQKSSKPIQKKRGLGITVERDWEQHWQGMPEYIQEDLKPWKTINVHFSSEEDFLEFSKLINQKMTLKTKFIWFPEIKQADLLSKRCIDESQVTT